MSSFISSTAWVPRGHAAAFPTKYVFDEDEYARISKLAKLELDDAKEDLEKARTALSSGNAPDAIDSDEDDDEEDEDDGDVEETAHDVADDDEHKHDDDDDDLREYDMEHYDDEPNAPGGAEEEDDDDDEPPSAIFGTIKSLAYHADNKDDPYITIPEGEASDDEEREELQVLPTDNMVLAARIEDEVAHLEVYVYEDDATNLYVHHDVMLPAVPLCVEWLGTRVGKDAQSNPDGGNFAAVGTMDPDIELWDLDVVDCMYPNAVLGQNANGTSLPLEPVGGKKKRRKKAKAVNDAYHIDAVLALAANRQHRTLLASASADTTVKLWDLNTCTAAHSYTHHTDKVCTLAWHPTQTSVLLSGSYDRTVAAVDMRAPTASVPRWNVAADVEQVRWDPHLEHQFYTSTEDGILYCFDARTLPTAGTSPSPSVWRLQAHEKSLSTLSLNPVVPGFIATGSTDRTVKLWNIAADGAGPSLVVSRDVGVGKVFAVNFAPDPEVAFRLAVAGSKGALQVWDTSTNRAVREAFATKVQLPEMAEGQGERLIGIGQDDEEEEEEAEAEEHGGEGGWESMDEN